MVRYAEAIRTNGGVDVSGQVARDPKTGDLTGANIQQQTERALENVKGILEAAGSVCCRMSAPVRSPVFGSSATCPETYRNPFVRMACEYGPMGFGPRSVRITSLMVLSPFQNGPPPRLVLGSARETLPALPGASSISLQTPRYSGASPPRTQRSDRSVRTRAPCEHATYG